jgi:hypothetical protein
MSMNNSKPGNNSCMAWILVIGFLLIFYSLNGQDFTDSIPVSAPYPVARLYCDSSGKSHFIDEELPFQLVDFAPPAPPISVSDILRTGGEAFFISSPAGWYGNWHPAPHRQLMVVLQGMLETEVSDGEFRTFHPGDVILVEDTLGRGHISRVTGEDRCYMLVIPLAEDE